MSNIDDLSRDRASPRESIPTTPDFACHSSKNSRLFLSSGGQTFCKRTTGFPVRYPSPIVGVLFLLFWNCPPGAAQSKGTCVAVIIDTVGLTFKNLCNRHLSITWSDGDSENANDIAPLSSKRVPRINASFLTVKVQDQ
jgi:hypothetical protein